MKKEKHEAEIAISHRLNAYELNVWMKHLERIQEEIDFMEKMWAFDVDGELEDNFVLQQLQESREQNTFLREHLKDYAISKPNDLLCEDFQCDVDLISKHESHRNKYLNYLDHYRPLKNKIFRMLQGKPVTNNNQEVKYG